MTAEEERAVQAARTAMARELQLDPATLDLVSIESRDWSDTSLGCPQPGTAYAQVITPGYIVVLASKGVRHTVHTDTRGQAVVCDSEMQGTAVPTEVVGKFTRTGGFAGRTDEVIVSADGTVRIVSGDETSTSKISSAQVRALQSLFASKDWRGVGDTYGSQVPDAFQYVITGGGQEVTTYDGATRPEIVEKLLSQFGRILSSSSRLP